MSETSIATKATEQASTSLEAAVSGAQAALSNDISAQVDMVAGNVPESFIQASLSGLAPFVIYMGIAIVLLAVFSALYLIATPHKEIALIKEGNKAAAIGFSGALIGFTFPLVKAMEQSVNIPDFMLWAGIGCITQLLAFVFSRCIFGNLKERIEKDQVSVGIAMAGISIVVGMLNAASMSY